MLLCSVSKRFHYVPYSKCIFWELESLSFMDALKIKLILILGREQKKTLFKLFQLIIY